MTRSGRNGSAHAIMLVRHPRLGEVKTRIGASLGDQAALDLHVRLARHTLNAMLALRACREATVEVRTDASFVHATREVFGRGPHYRYQGEGDLGDRIRLALAEAFRRGEDRVIVVGSDCPRLGAGHLRAALAGLETSDVVIGPAADGGYYLIGARRQAANRVLAALFAQMPWGTSDVFTETVHRAQAAGLGIVELETLPDVDLPEDLSDAEAVLAAEETADAVVSVVIPTLDEETTVAEAVRCAIAGGAGEVIVADGGSHDRTVEIAEGAGAHVVVARPGRARQLNEGAAHATGGVLCFLHADTRLPAGFAASVRAALAPPHAVACAFDFAVEHGGWRHRLIGDLGQLRWRLGGLPYGDQALCAPRWVFDALGGYADLPTMEDYDLAQRLRRYGRITRTRQPAITSARVWDEHGLLRPTLVNGAVIVGFRLGADPARLARWRTAIGRRASGTAHAGEGRPT